MVSGKWLEGKQDININIFQLKVPIKLEEQDLKLIFNAIESGKCIAFLGAGACTSFKVRGEEKPGLPLGKDLVKLLAEKCNFSNGKAFDLPTMAEYFVYAKCGDRSELENALQRVIYSINTPRPIHTVLAQLKHIKIIITSNYDILLETELNKYKRYMTRHIQNIKDPKTAHFEGKFFWKDEDIVLYKMHGSIDEPRGMVITQSDYIRFLANLNDKDRGVPDYFKLMIPQHHLLFLGYSLEDWNFRVIWEGVLLNYQNLYIDRKSYAIMKEPKDFIKSYWQDKRVKVINEDLTNFAIELAKHFNLEIPQLGIEKKEEATQQ